MKTLREKIIKLLVDNSETHLYPDPYFVDQIMKLIAQDKKREWKEIEKEAKQRFVWMDIMDGYPFYALVFKYPKAGDKSEGVARKRLLDWLKKELNFDWFGGVEVIINISGPKGFL